MRINARLEGESERKFREILEMTHRTQTDAIKEAIAAYHRDLTRGKTDHAAKTLEACGFVGSGAGNPNLSRDYKKLLGRHMRRKT